MSKAIRVGIVGFGGMAGWHYKRMSSSGLFEVVGIFDIDSGAKANAVRLGLESYSSFDILLKQDIELLLIATPNHLHHEYAVKALSAGINVLCEKPATLSSKSLELMIKASIDNNKILTVHQNRRWDKDYLIVKQLYKDSQIGGITCIDSNVTGSHGVPGAWRKVKEFGGGMLLDWGVHMIDQILCLHSHSVTSVYCRGSYVYGLDCDDGIVLSITFDDGFVANINIATNCFIPTPRWIVHAIDGTAIIKNWSCRGKIVRVKHFLDNKNKGITAGNGFTKTMADRSKSTIISSALPKVREDNLALYKDLHNCITQGGTPIVKMDEVMRCMRVMESAFKSMELNEVIKTKI